MVLRTLAVSSDRFDAAGQAFANASSHEVSHTQPSLVPEQRSTRVDPDKAPTDLENPSRSGVIPTSLAATLGSSCLVVYFF